jgi:hypothetical protein
MWKTTNRVKYPSTTVAVYTPVRKARLTGPLMMVWCLKGTSPFVMRRIGEALCGSMFGVTPTSIVMAGAPMVEIEFVNFK